MSGTTRPTLIQRVSCGESCIGQSMTIKSSRMGLQFGAEDQVFVVPAF